MISNEKLANTVSIVYEQFGKKATSVNFETWNIALEDLSEAQVDIGIRKLLKEYQGSFMPTTGQFISMCKGSDGNLTNEDQASDAWVEVTTAVRRFGYTKSICFADTATTQAILNIGGWVNLCQTLTSENAPFKRKEFIASHSSKVNVSLDSSPFLIGGFGFDENSVAFVGLQNDEDAQVYIDHHKEVTKDQFKIIGGQ